MNLNVTFASAAHYIAAVIGFGTLAIGFCAVFRPQAMSKRFGIEASTEALPYVVSTGIRDVFIGLIVLILFYYKNWRLVGAANLCISIVAISDFLVVRHYGNKKNALSHLLGAVSVFAYGIWLLL